jgi:hypothetical protein
MNMPRFEPGDIFFVMHKNNILSRLIAKWMGSKWSHCGLVIEHGNLFIHTSETSDFQIVGSYLESYMLNDKVELEVLRLPIQQAFGVQMALDATTRNQWLYGWLQLLVSFNIKLLLKRVNIKIKNFIRMGLVCNHHVLYACQKSGLEFFNSLDVEEYETQETYEMLKAQGARTIFYKESK